MSVGPPPPEKPPGFSRPALSTVPAAGARGTSGWVVLVALAGVMLVVVGAFHLAQGFGALITDQRFLLRDTSLFGGTSVTAWGWLHLAVGAVVVLAGILIFAGSRWARAVGVIVSLLSAASAISLLPDHPGWVLAVLGVDALVVLALTVHGSEIRAH
jgi:hypothetical protein